MDKLIIKGGKKLCGEVAVSGSKNAALPILFATILTPGVHEIRNVPALRDINTTIRLLETLGARVEGRSGTVKVDAGGIDQVEATYDLVKTMRASVLVLGPLLARFGRSRVSLPGGCAIGARPIDQHLKGLAALGAEIRLSHGYVEAEAKQPGIVTSPAVLASTCTASSRTVTVSAGRAPARDCSGPSRRRPSRRVGTTLPSAARRRAADRRDANGDSARRRLAGARPDVERP